MALNYRPVDRDQVFLLPPDMRQWLPADHLAWFVLDTIARLDVSALDAKSKRGGVGREGYNPRMLLGLWIYASARGICSSRQIERACSQDVAFRVLCAQDVPDHTVLARFRQRHQDAMADLFGQVLALCVRAGMGRFGMVAIDGTKIAANASISRSVTLARLRKLAEAELAKAAQQDAAEDAAGAPGAHDDVPPAFTGSGRGARIDAAIADLQRQIEDENKAELAARAEALAVARRRRVRAEADARERVRVYQQSPLGRRPMGRPPVAVPVAVRRARGVEAVAARALARSERRQAEQIAGASTRERRLGVRNTTDAQSRIMRTRQGFVQGYNAQLAVTDDHLIAVAVATNCPSDAGQFMPMMRRCEQVVDELVKRAGGRGDLRIGVITADAGYLSEEAVTAAGPARLIAPGQGRARAGEGWTGTVPRPGSAATKAMMAAFDNEANKRLYKRRGATVETVNAHVKDGRGLRRFARRGLDAVQAELLLAALSTNLVRLFGRIGPRAKTWAWPRGPLACQPGR